MAKFNKFIFLFLLGNFYLLNPIYSTTPDIKNNKNFYFNDNITLFTKKYINASLKNKLIAYYINEYTKNNELSKLLKRSKNVLKYVLVQLQQRNLPKELALLPIIESSYHQLAVSNKGATGIWQISNITGKRYGLIISNSIHYIDHRFDIIISTDAALSYLTFLHKTFNNDWLLAIAAYNAGEGRILRAIKKNVINGKNPNYWTLILPKETIHYVPRLLALVIIFNNPQKYGLDLLDLNW